MVTRVNGSGYLEVQDTQSKGYIPVFAPIPSVGGTPVALTGEQLELLSNINDLLTYIQIYHEEFSALITSILKSSEDPSTGSKKFLQDLITLVQSLIAKQSDIIQGLTNVQNTISSQNSFPALPKIYNVSINANEEKSFTLPLGVKQFTWKCRAGDGDTTSSIRYSYEPGIVNSTIASGYPGYYVLSDGQEETEKNLNLRNNLNIYFWSPVATWISIKYWI